MEDFPANSHKSRDDLRPDSPPRTGPSEEPIKRVERVTTGKVIRRKKPLGSRIKDVFLGADAASVGHYIWLDILVPAAKDMLVDMASQGAERLVFGEDNRFAPRRRSRGGATRVYTDYSRYSWGESSARRAPRDRPPSGHRAPRHDRVPAIDDVILESRAEAGEVVEKLYDILNRYDVVTVADFYATCGITAPYTDNNWGWTDLQGTGVRRVHEGYLVELPRVEPLK